MYWDEKENLNHMLNKLERIGLALENAAHSLHSIDQSLKNIAANSAPQKPAVFGKIVLGTPVQQ
jgi:hypothetical protein